MNEVTEAVTTKKASNVTVKPTTCEASWTRVERSIGGWCLKVYNGFVHQDQASQACIRIGAELSGSESSAERAVIARLGKERMLAASDYKFGTIRVGIARPTTTRAWALTDGNNDGGQQGIQWSKGEPQLGPTSGYSHNCALMWIWASTGTSPYEHGKYFHKFVHLLGRTCTEDLFVESVLLDF